MIDIYNKKNILNYLLINNSLHISCVRCVNNNINDYFKCIKIPIKNVLKHYDINLPKITDAVLMCNKIVIHTLMFMKLYLLDYYETHKCLPIIDNEFVNSCMKILCNESTNGRPPKKR